MGNVKSPLTNGYVGRIHYDILSLVLLKFLIFIHLTIIQ